MPKGTLKRYAVTVNRTPTILKLTAAAAKEYEGAQLLDDPDDDDVDQDEAAVEARTASKAKKAAANKAVTVADKSTK